jgi:hypothetical protein
MSLRKFSNNAVTTLAANITSAATTLSVVSGTGSLFPAITSPQDFSATLVKNGNPSVFEVIYVTGRSGDTFTAIARAQEGTSAVAWNAGDTVALFPTAAGLAAFAQFDDLQDQSTNYAVDVGSANAYSVTLSPALLGHVVGMPIRFLAAHTNTGASTFNDGFGGAGITTQEGAVLVAGEITAGGIYEIFFTGSNFQLAGVHALAFSQISGSVSNAQVPVGAVTQYDTTLFASPALTGSPVAPTPAIGNSSTLIATTAFVNRGSVISGNGYRRNPDSSIDQWGSAAYGGSAGTLTITFPLPFPNNLFSLVAIASIGGYQPGLQSFNTSQATLSMSNLNGGTPQTVYWRAIGD